MILDLKNREVSEEVLKDKEVIPNGLVPVRKAEKETIEGIKNGRQYLIIDKHVAKWCDTGEVFRI